MTGVTTGVEATSPSSKGSVSPDVAIGDVGFGTMGDAGTVAGDMAPSVTESNGGTMGWESEDMLL